MSLLEVPSANGYVLKRHLRVKATAAEVTGHPFIQVVAPHQIDCQAVAGFARGARSHAWNVTHAALHALDHAQVWEQSLTLVRAGLVVEFEAENRRVWVIGFSDEGTRHFVNDLASCFLLLQPERLEELVARRLPVGIELVSPQEVQRLLRLLQHTTHL